MNSHIKNIDKEPNNGEGEVCTFIDKYHGITRTVEILKKDKWIAIRYDWAVFGWLLRDIETGEEIAISDKKYLKNLIRTHDKIITVEDLIS